MLQLLQIILAGVRSESGELASLACILLSATLPRVNLKPKAANKLAKAIRKYWKAHNSEDTLFLALLLARWEHILQSNYLFLEYGLSENSGKESLIFAADTSDSNI